MRDTLRQVYVRATNYDGSSHWEHPAWLVEAGKDVVITRTQPGLAVARGDGVAYTSPFETRGHYWPDRWFNVIRLDEPDAGLSGFYCNIATPVEFDGATVRYVDLQLDVRVFARDGQLTHKLFDADEFEAARQRFQYPEELVQRCRRAVDEVIALVEARLFPFDR